MTCAMRFALLPLLCVLAVGCSKGTPFELAELVIRTQFRDVPPDAVACISVDGHDADDRLLGALGDIGVKVVPGSNCMYVADSGKGSYEKKTGQKAVLVSVTTHLNRGEAEYLSRYHGKWAMRAVLKVSHENGKWRIADVVTLEAA